jgi:hypothetical protein
MRNFVILFVMSLSACSMRSGLPGANGLNAAFETAAADSSQCSNGGSILSFGLDRNSDLVLQPEETQKVVVTCNGNNGQDGQDGQNGTNGTNGQDATPVTMVKLCPGTTTYPSVFVEYAACLNGKLYGVYSTHGGFWTYLPDGNYQSNTVGSNCNLTVSGCTVTN